MKRLLVAATAAALIATAAPAGAAVDQMLPGSAGATAPVIALGPEGEAYVVARSATGGTSFWSVNDESATALAPAGLFSNLPGGAPGGLAVDTAGYPHVAQRNMQTSNVRRSIDGGSTWDRGTPIAAPGKIQSLAATNFNSIVEGSTLYALSVFRNNIIVSISDDGGLTFQDQEIIEQQCAICVDTLSNMAVTPDGNVWLAYSDPIQGFGFRKHDFEGSSISYTFMLPAPVLREPATLSVGPDGSVYAALALADGGFEVVRLDNVPHDNGYITDAEVTSAQVAVGDGSVGVSWIQTDDDGVDRVYFRSGPDLANLDDPIVVGPTTGAKVALVTDTSNVYRVAYQTEEGLRFQTLGGVL
ncbi:MAG: repeat-like domain [Actinomycetota bacterium]|jgi:hypothetical protein|nr:repeat-like domain [Actinomycetota bacterium]